MKLRSIKHVDKMIENRRKQDERRQRRRYTEEDLAAYRADLIERHGLKEEEPSNA